MSAAAQALAAPVATTGAEGGQGGEGQPAAVQAPQIEWAKDLAPEVALWAAKKNFDNPTVALTSQFHLEKMLGQDKLPLPKDEADKAGWDAVWNKLGRPAKAEDYFAGAQGVWPDGFTPDPALLEGFQKVAHELGLNTRQARELAKWQVQAAQAGAIDPNAAAAEFEKASEADWEGLKKEHGMKFDAVVADMQKAARFADIDADTFEKIEAAIGTKRATEIFAKLGSAFGKELSFVDGKLPGGKPTVEQARARITELQNDRAWAKAYTEGGTQSKEFREMEELQKISNGAA